MSAGELQAWAAGLPAGSDAERARACREREFARSTPTTTACSASAGCSTTATWSCARSGCCTRARTCASARRGASGTSWSTTSRPPTSPRACCSRCSCDEHGKVTIAAADEAVDRPRHFPSDAEVAWTLERNQRSGRRIVQAAAGRAGTEPGAQGRSRERRPRALLALPLRARAGPGGGRRGGAADRRRRGRRGDLRARALGPGRGSHRGLRARGARGAVPHLRRRRLLPARRGARRARLAARAGRSGGLRRRGARAQPPAGRAASSWTWRGSPSSPAGASSTCPPPWPPRSRAPSSPRRDATAPAPSSASIARPRRPSTSAAPTPS